MYEEDRQRALALYNSIFDEADDEQAILHLLVSPTRQAVNLARAYDAKERKLQVHTQSRADDTLAGEEDELPAFVQVIEALRAEAAALGVAAPKESDDQLSLFSDEGDDSLFQEETPAPAEEEPAEEVPAEEASAEAEAPADEEAPLPAQAQPEPVEPAQEEPQAPVDEVDAFLQGFSIEDEAPAQEPREEVPAEEPDTTPAVPLIAPAGEIAAPAEDGEPSVPTKRKARGFLLFLFILLAIPVTLACIAALLVPTLLAFFLGLSALYGGVMSFITGIAHFSVFADILLVIGGSLIVLALGLLFAWIFIWLLGGVIPGLIRGVCALGRKWCYKEVPAA